MKVHQVFADKYKVLGTMDQESCPTMDFLLAQDKNTAAYRAGLLQMLEHVALHGFGNIPAAWTHEANKEEGIYEFIKGPLRLFFFKGEGDSIAVCTCGVRKSGQKADKAAVSQAIKIKDAYWTAVKNGNLEIIEHEDC